MSAHPADWWHTEGDRVVCDLCPRYCKIPEGGHGFCYIRQVRNGELVSIGYGRPTGFAVDPVEKKPLNHFLPGAPTLSFGTAGCNLACKFCQNWSISKAQLTDLNSLDAPPERVVELALKQGCQAIAYTYNDPVIYGEYVRDTARLARQAGLKNIMVSAGYITAEARADVFECIDAANIDLKGYTEGFYRKLCGGVHLDPVRETLCWLVHETDVWVEVTTLLIPGENDSPEEIAAECRWLRDELGPDVPVHFTAFHPDYKLRDRPGTPAATLRLARDLARQAGLNHVYVGNVHDAEGQTTRCPGCGEVLVERDWFRLGAYTIRDGGCGHCGTPVAGVFGAAKGSAVPGHIPVWRPGESRAR